MVNGRKKLEAKHGTMINATRCQNWQVSVTTLKLKEDLACFRCGVCCKRYQVRVNLVEARRIVDNMGISWNEFLDEYVDHRYIGAENFLIRQCEGACVFLKRIDEKQTCCLIHEFKPSSCREWAPGLFRRECREGLSELWGLEVDQNGEEIYGPSDKLFNFYTFLVSVGASDFSVGSRLKGLVTSQRIMVPAVVAAEEPELMENRGMLSYEGVC